MTLKEAFIKAEMYMLSNIPIRMFKKNRRWRVERL